uniref:Uncharacterized protein n=1 Tax=Trichogramma kaykai TaxID=54128 RepID=A0ABD2WA12_9HYME
MPFNVWDSIFPELIYHSKAQLGCPSAIGISAATATDPLSVDIILDIVFFMVLLVTIIASFVIFRLRRQSKDKSVGTVMNRTTNAIITGGRTHLVQTSKNNMVSRCENTYITDGPALTGPPEILSKKYKERDLNNVKAVAATATKTSSAKHRPPQRPDTIDREILKPLQAPKSRGGDDDHSMTVTMITKEPGPYDIDIVYHYKLYRDNMRTYKTSQPPPMSNNYHHQNQQSQS